MITLVIPDLHHKTDLAERVIANTPHDKIVFLGDYFDHFDDTPLDAERTALWLRDSLNKPNRIHLFGNHDLPYWFPSKLTWCPGWTPAKDSIVRRVLTENHWQQFRFFYLEQGVLLSHAGITHYLFDQWLSKAKENWPEQLAAEQKACINAIQSYTNHWMYQCGRDRGGQQPVGGLLWCDVRFFRQGEGYPPQIFGHTPVGPIRVENNCYCIDSPHDKFYVATIVNGQVEIHDKSEYV